ncbi:hypothetical protein SAY87_030007 [Trapa incisa]|uniref:Uncharacterized protein n=1 Tax=Trapa incisa TaxID=236973 RepID=A0AAN7Q9X6_9MYRT|nr:hypothetical protein SAY87_030007 [Trapa incisa]
MDNLFCRDHLFTRSVLMASIFVALVARTVIGGTDNAPAESYTKTAEEEEAGPESEPDGAVISEEEEDTEEKSEMEARRFFTGSMLITWIFVSSVTGFAIVGTNYAPAASYIGAKGLNFPVEAQKLRDNMADNMNLWCANSLSNPVAEDRDDEGDELQEDEPEENKFRRTNPETELSAMFEVAAIHDQPENNSSDALAFISARSNAIQPYRIIAPAGVLIVAVFAAVGAYLVHVKKRATSANGPQLEKEKGR